MTHADLALGLNEEKVKEICLSKIDVALDLAGAFIPPDGGRTYSLIWNKLQTMLKKIFSQDAPNLLSARRILGLKVVKGKNSLKTCF